MSKELEYEVNNFANLLHKDCMNLMECLKKQGEDNKPILYLGKHYKKVILPYEEYQKMYNRLEAIDNAEPSEALECLEYIENKLHGLRVECERIKNHRCDDVFIQEHTFDTIKQALLKAQKEHKALEIIKGKTVSIFQLSCCKNVNEYNDLRFKFSEKLTKEDFNLLKEVVG